MEEVKVKKAPNFTIENCNAVLPILAPKSALLRMKEVAEKERLSLKDEFHITLIGKEAGDVLQKKLQDMSVGDRELALQNIHSLLAAYAWSYTAQDVYYLVSKTYEDKEVRRSLLQIVRVPELKDFTVKLGALFGVHFSIPFPHVTLYATSTKADTNLRGIGIYSKEYFHTLNPQRLS